MGLRELLTTAAAHHQAGRLDLAEPLYRQVLASVPNQPDALHLLGLLHHHKGDPDTAIRLISQAIAIQSHEAAYFSNRGEAYRALGRLSDAVADYRKAIALAPNSAAAHNNLALALKALGQSGGARRALERALAVKAAFPEAQNNLGLVLEDLHEMDAATAAFRKAVSLRPGYWEAHNNLGRVLLAAGRTAEARAEFETGLAAAPPAQRAQFLIAIANILADAHDHVAAIARLTEATVLDPANAVAFNNLAASQQRLDQFDEAISNFRRAIALRLDYADAHRSLGSMLLMLQQFDQGWRAFAWRWKCSDFAGRRRPFAQPAWNGDPDVPGPLLVWGEQGVGDEVLCASMLPDLLNAGVDVIWEADRRLVPLFARSFTGATVIPRETPPQGMAARAAAQIPAADLGMYFRNDAARFPRDRRSYLVADRARAEGLRNQVPLKPGERLVGLSWVSANTDVGSVKTLPLREWAPILQVPGVRFVDLQYGDTAAERAQLRADLGVEVHHVDSLDLRADLDGLAALISACDLVISVSNTTVHVAGALGVPVWVILPSYIGRFWYWGRDATSTPWYPTVTLFAQGKTGDRNAVLEKIAQRLAEDR